MMSVDAIIFDVANGDRPKRAHVPSTVATLKLDEVPVQANLQKLQ